MSQVTTIVGVKQAQSHEDCVFYFGKFRGLSIREVWEQEDGPSWLDWIMGQPEFSGYPKRCLAKFLQNPALREELEDVEDKTESWFETRRQKKTRIQRLICTHPGDFYQGHPCWIVSTFYCSPMAACWKWVEARERIYINEEMREEYWTKKGFNPRPEDQEVKYHASVEDAARYKVLRRDTDTPPEGGRKVVEKHRRCVIAEVGVTYPRPVARKKLAAWKQEVLLMVAGLRASPPEEHAARILEIYKKVPTPKKQRWLQSYLEHPTTQVVVPVRVLKQKTVVRVERGSDRDRVRVYEKVMLLHQEMEERVRIEEDLDDLVRRWKKPLWKKSEEGKWVRLEVEDALQDWFIREVEAKRAEIKEKLAAGLEERQMGEHGLPGLSDDAGEDDPRVRRIKRPGKRDLVDDHLGWEHDVPPRIGHTYWPGLSLEAHLAGLKKSRVYVEGAAWTYLDNLRGIYKVARDRERKVIEETRAEQARRAKW